MKKLVIITTHPVQYYAPLFKLLDDRKEVEIRVLYTWGEGGSKKHDPGFARDIEWDLPLLEGYSFEWVKNTSRNPGSHHFWGIRNPDLISRISRLKPDAILVIGWAYLSHLNVMRFFKGKIPVYFRGDSTLLDERVGLKTLIKRHFLNWVYSYADRAFYVGSQNKKYFVHCGFNESSLSFTPHAIDNNRFSEERKSEAQYLRDQFELGSSDILILFSGKFEKKKDPEILLKVFQSLNKPYVHLLFAGNGPLEQKLRGACRTLKIKNVHFMSFQNQTHMPVLYQACDLFCLPSRGPGESWGLAINEAMASGKAILASDKVGSVYDLVKPSENGFIFNAGDSTELREKLDLLTHSRSLLETYGKSSNRIISKWNFSVISAAIEQQLNHEPDRRKMSI